MKMSEEETNKGTETPAADTGDGDKHEESKAVEKLRKDNERLEKQLSKKKELLAEQKILEAREALGGGSEAGRPSEKKKETPQEASKRYVEENFANLK